MLNPFWLLGTNWKSSAPPSCRLYLTIWLLDKSRGLHALLFDDRRAGGLGAAQSKKDADVWTIARAVQLLASTDQVVRLTARGQLDKTVSKGVSQPSNSPLPLSDYLSGSTEGGLYDTRFYGCVPNTWTRTRKAARRLNARIDVSNDSSPSKVIADDISCLSAKAILGLRTVIRQRCTTELSNASNQGRVARGLLLDT